MPDSSSDRVLIEGALARAVSPEGKTATMHLASLFAALFPPRIDTGALILPDGTVKVSSSGPWTALVTQIPPRINLFRWVDSRSRIRFGPGTRYAQVRIALPYLIIVSVFHDGVLSHINECFFRNKPITSDDDLLLYPALLNCSRFKPADGRPLSWICTQHLDPLAIGGDTPAAKIRAGFEALRHCLIETGFNESSEYHEGASWYAESRSVDARISSIQAWEKATDVDSLFVLDIPWLPTGLSVAQVVERIFRNQHASAKVVASAGDLARAIFNHVA